MSSTWMWVLLFVAGGVMLNLWQNRSPRSARTDIAKRGIERLQERNHIARTFYWLLRSAEIPKILPDTLLSLSQLLP
jgi:hypothetical protein